MTKKIEEAAKLGRRLPKIKENITEAQVRVSWFVGYEYHFILLCCIQEAFNEASAQIAEFDAKMGELESPDHLNTRKTQIQGEMRTNKNRLNEYNVRH